MTTPNSTSSSPAPPPWRLRGTIYTFLTYTTAHQLRAGPNAAEGRHHHLPRSFLYAPLEKLARWGEEDAEQEPPQREREPEAAEDEAEQEQQWEREHQQQDEGLQEEASSTFRGGLGMVQVLRYTDSPVGAYDELVVVPGAFEWGGTGDGHGMAKARKGRERSKVNARVTRIYVSQARTCWNGRKNWNIPKHLATFTFTPLTSSSSTDTTTTPTPSTSPSTSPIDTNTPLRITVTPYTTDPVTRAEIPAPEGTTPFFTAVYHPIRYLPAIPMTTALARYVGVDLRLVQPPLPSGGRRGGDSKSGGGPHTGGETGATDARDGQGNVERDAKDDNDDDDNPLPGTTTWCQVLPVERTRAMDFGWWDLKQPAHSSPVTPPLPSRPSSSSSPPTPPSTLTSPSLPLPHHADADETTSLLLSPSTKGMGANARSTGDDDTNSNDEDSTHDKENWWPNTRRRWRLGMRMRNAVIEFPVGERW